ncbi:hypothetical protein Hanom_Chr01g00028391 [Helianthus anomalus]
MLSRLISMLGCTAASLIDKNCGKTNNAGQCLNYDYRLLDLSEHEHERTEAPRRHHSRHF